MKRISRLPARLLSMIALIVMGFGPAIAESTLGLAERRALKNYQEQIYPGLLKEIQQAAGFELPVDVRWNEIALAGLADRYQESGFFTDIYFTPLIKALQRITADQIGKDAVKSGLKQIVVRFDEGTAPASNYANGLNFADGILTINFQPWSNTADVEPRTGAMVKVLEAGL